VAAVIAGSVACSDVGDALPAAITCTAQARPDHASDAGQVTEQLTVLRSPGVPPAAQTLELPGFRLEVTYVGDAPEGRNVRVVVTSDDGEPLVSTLYQFDKGEALRGGFGTHGFTGLQYVRDGAAELQVYCGPDEEDV
jgi:hypothetical protein